MSRTRWNGVRGAAIAAVLAVVVAACGGSARGGDGLTGTINGAGSSTVFPITEAITEEFRAVEPGISVPIASTGTGGGFERFCAGETDFSNASRPITDEEAQACEDNDVEWIELQVAVDGLTVVVNPANDWVDCLTVEELSTIWGPESEGTITSWSQVRDGFPDRRLALFGPGSDSGTFDYFTEAINGEEGAQRTDYNNIGEIDEQTVQGVSGDEGGIGYFGFAFFVTYQGQVKAVAVDGGDGCVVPSEETVRNGTYTPLSRPLFIYVTRDALSRPEVVAYFEFYLDTVNEIISDVGYVPMDEELLAEQVAKLQAGIA